MQTNRLNEEKNLYLNSGKAYIMRQDGEIFFCEIMHPYIKLIFEDTAQTIEKLSTERLWCLEWFYSHTMHTKTRENIQIILNYFVKNNLVDIEKLNYFSDWDFNDEIYVPNNYELGGFIETLNDDTNQEFLRIRMSALLFGGTSREIFFKLSSVGYNWFNSIWELVYQNRNNLSEVTISKDTNVFGGRFNCHVVGGKSILHLPVEDFINLPGNPIVENYCGESEYLNDCFTSLKEGKTLTESLTESHPKYAHGFFESLYKDIDCKIDLQ